MPSFFAAASAEIVSDLNPVPPPGNCESPVLRIHVTPFFAAVLFEVVAACATAAPPSSAAIDASATSKCVFVKFFMPCRQPRIRVKVLASCLDDLDAQIH